MGFDTVSILETWLEQTVISREIAGGQGGGLRLAGARRETVVRLREA